LIQGNQSTLKTLESKLASNVTTSKSVGNVTNKANRITETASKLKNERASIQQKLDKASEFTSPTLANRGKHSPNSEKLKFQNQLKEIDGKIALNKRQADKLDNIDTKGNLNQGLNSAKEVSTKVPNFTANELRVSLGKNGYRELGKFAKVIESSPVQLAWTLAKASMKIAGAGAVEYGEEFGEEVFNQLRDNTGTDKKLDLNKARIAGAIGFSAGASIGIGTEVITKEYVDVINSKTYKVDELKSKEVKRNPYAPFTTSTLQQDAGNKFGYSAASTMGKAQK
jgi:hypothetical protein